MVVFGEDSLRVRWCADISLSLLANPGSRDKMQMPSF
jgi:hypothetical protein